MPIVTHAQATAPKKRTKVKVFGARVNSATGTRTWVARVRADNQLDYSGDGVAVFSRCPGHAFRNKTKTQPTTKNKPQNKKQQQINNKCLFFCKKKKNKIETKFRIAIIFYLGF